MKSITILLLHMQHGGIEKQTISLANELCKKYDVTIISTYSMNKEPAYYVDSKVKIKYLINDKPNPKEFKDACKKMRIKQIVLQGLKAIKILYLKKKLMVKEIKKIETNFILSTRLEFAKMLSLYAPKEVVTLTQEHLHNDSKRYISKIRKSFKNIDYLIVLCDGSKKNYESWLKNNKRIKILKIPNMLENIPNESSELTGNKLIAVGRLHPVKNFETLIKVFSIVHEEIPSSSLEIIGGGNEFTNLQHLVSNMKLENSVELSGMQNEEFILQKMIQSDIYVMTSLTECFPMVLLEAESCGLPIISFDVPVGPKAIVQNNKNGYLIPFEQTEVMAKNIIEILTNRKKLKEFGKNSKDCSYNYKAEKIIQNWYNIFDKGE